MSPGRANRDAIEDFLREFRIICLAELTELISPTGFEGLTDNVTQSHLFGLFLGPSV